MTGFLRRKIRAWFAASEAGFTLVELLVTMLVMGIIFAALPFIVSSTTRLTAANSTRLQSMTQARVSVESAARLLRTAVVPKQLGADSGDSAFIQGDDFHVQFYADINNPDNSVGPSRVTLKVDNGTLVQIVQPPDQPVVNYDYQWSDCVVGATGCTKRQTTLATDVQMSAAVFTYYMPDANGVDHVLTGQQPYDADALGTVDAIEITVTVGKHASSPIAADTYISRVALLNKASIVQGQGNGS